MKPQDELAIAEFFNKRGRLFTPSLTSEWEKPTRVERHSRDMAGALMRGNLPYGSELRIWTTFSHGSSSKSRWVITADPDLLERFLNLGEASDENIWKFASKYGGLEIFYRMDEQTDVPTMVHVEYCDVWRYFARAMRALLKIAARMHTSNRGSKEDWNVLARPPRVMRQTARKSGHEFSKRPALGNEENWLALAHFVSKEHQQNRRMLTNFFNTLLGLGYVRPWIVWSDTESQSRPHVVYSSRSLLSNLALQICLRAAKVDAFVLCAHCQRQYLPVKRAPKVGQRNFCPECRKQDIPAKYALQDFRKRRRNLSDSETR